MIRSAEAPLPEGVPRVPHVVHILEATTGGTRRHLRDLVTGLDPACFRQTVIASTLRDTGFQDDIELFRSRGIAVHCVPMLRRPAPFADAMAARRILRLLRELAPDVVHTHSSKAGFLGRWAAHRAGIRKRIHSPHVFAFEMKVPAPVRGGYRLAERLAARWTTMLVCVSAAEGRAAETLGRRRPPVRVVHNGIDVPHGKPAPLLDGPTVRVALIGRLCPQKGQDTLAHALLQNPALARSCHVELVGIPATQRLPAAVRTAAESGLCHIVPPLCPDAMQAYLDSVDVVVQPSRWEGLPYTLLEAMAAGRCVVASAVGGVPELVADGRNGRLVPPDDTVRLASALAEVADRREDCRAWGQAARETVLRHFRKDVMLEALSQLYQGTR